MYRLIKIVNHYGFTGLFRLIVDKLRSYFVFKNSKLIRFPFEVRGKHQISVGNGFTTGRYCRIETYSTVPNKKVLIIGNNCQINDSVHIVAMEQVLLGDNVLIASKVFITDLNHGQYSGDILEHSSPNSIVSSRPLNSSPVIIGDNCWLGENVTILPGVKLGNNCIVGANSLVNKCFDENSIIGGNPARLLKRYCQIKKEWIAIGDDK